MFLTGLVLPHLHQLLHLADPLSDGLVHHLQPLHVGGVHLVGLQERGQMRSQLLRFPPLRASSSSGPRRYRYRSRS